MSPTILGMEASKFDEFELLMDFGTGMISFVIVLFCLVWLTIFPHVVAVILLLFISMTAMGHLIRKKTGVLKTDE